MPPMMKCMWCKCTFSVTTILSIRCHPWWNVCDVNAHLVLRVWPLLPTTKDQAPFLSFSQSVGVRPLFIVIHLNIPLSVSLLLLITKCNPIIPHLIYIQFQTSSLYWHWLKDLTSYAVNKNNKAWFFDCSSLSLSYFVFKVAEVLACLILYLRLLKA
jgi:hypothetical protein